MKTLWDKLKPEYKQTLKENQEKYDTSPQLVEKVLRSKRLFTHLTIMEMLDLYEWTNTSWMNLESNDLFGDNFLIEE